MASGVGTGGGGAPGAGAPPNFENIVNIMSLEDKAWFQLFQ